MAFFDIFVAKVKKWIKSIKFKPRVVDLAQKGRAC